MRRVIALLISIASIAAFATSLSAQQPAVRANRVILRVANLGTSIRFYRDQVGLPLQSTFDEFAVFGGDGMTLMLQQVERKSSGAATGLPALTEVVLEAADVMKTCREMKERGVTLLREPFAATTDGPRVLYAAPFKDPDGHILSITGWVDRQ
jgi:catechol 2,3-dioxygenase-like lactoylglutathione lyase family enzyme